VSADPNQLASRLPGTSSLARLRARPDVLAWLAIGVSFVAMATVGAWNAAYYPMALGYDYNSTANYMHVVLTDHRLPTYAESAESRQPPVYYIVGGLAARAGHRFFGWNQGLTPELPENSYTGAQALNVFFVLGTALLLLSLARTVAPRSPTVWAAALAFFAFLPVVAKTAAMVHPEPMNMFLSTLAVWLATKIVRAPALSARLLGLLVLVLAIGLATRASIVFTAAAIAIGLAVRYGRHLNVRRSRRQAGAILLTGALVAALVAWLAAGGAHSGSLAALAHPFTRTSANRDAFFRIPFESLFTTPYRPHFVNSAFGETYTEIWGDWLGSFAWSSYMITPSAAALSVLKNQNWIGIVPSLLAIAGYVLLLFHALRRRREFLALALIPPFALAGYLFRTYQTPSPDGDLIKASYVLTTAPIWALGFGLAFAKLGRFRLTQLGIGAVLVVFAVLELRFMMYGIRDGQPPF
jgi:hypothetical protein